MAVSVTAPVSQRMLLEDISWETYERLLADQRDRSAPRISYDRGRLEFVTLGRDHERDNRTIANFIFLVAAEIGTDLVAVGSMTYRRAAVQRGFEPDSSFYIQHVEVGRHDDFDVSVDPPPDLVIEIDASRSSLDKLDLYFQLGVSEVWIWEDGQATFLLLGNDGYESARRSRALPIITADAVTRFADLSRSLNSVEWYRAVVAWARAL